MRLRAANLKEKIEKELIYIYMNSCRKRLSTLWVFGRPRMGQDVVVAHIKLYKLYNI